MALSSTKAEQPIALEKSLCIQFKLSTSLAENVEVLALEFAKCNFEVFQILETNCKYLGSKWGELGSFLQNMKPKCFFNLANNKFENFPEENLKFLKPSIFEWFSKTDLKNLFDKISDVNILSDEQFKMINKTAFSLNIGSSLKASFLNSRKSQTLRFALRSDFFERCLYKPIGMESFDELKGRLLSLPNVLKLTALLLGDIVVKELRDGDLSLEAEFLGNTGSFLSTLIKLSVKNYRELQTDKIASFSRQIYQMSCLANVLKTGLPSMLATYSHLAENLPDGESILFPYGWRTNSGGHAMLLELAKLEKGSVFLKVYNSGDGIETYHVKKRFDSRLKYLPYIKTKPFHLRRLKETNFFEAIYSLNVSQPDSLEELSSKEAYKIILTRFEIEYEDELDDDKFIMTQFAGTCAIRSILAFLHVNLSSREYYLLKHAISVEAVTLLQEPPSDLWVDLLIRFTRYLIKDLIRLNLVSDYDKLFNHLKGLQSRKISLVPLKLQANLSSHVSHVLNDELIERWVSVSDFEKRGFLQPATPKFPEKLDEKCIGKSILGNSLSEIVSSLNDFTATDQPSERYLSYFLARIRQLPVDYDVKTQDPLHNLNLLKSITFYFMKFASPEKERSVSMLLAATKILFTAWNAAKSADNQMFSDCPECKMEKYGFSNPFYLESAKFVLGSPVLFELANTTKKFPALEKGLFNFMSRFSSYITLESSIFEYLKSLETREKKSVFVDNTNRSKILSLSSVDSQLIKASLLYINRDKLPPQFLMLRDIFFMLQLVFTSHDDKDGKYNRAIELIYQNQGDVLFQLDDIPVSYNARSYASIKIFDISVNIALTQDFLVNHLQPKFKNSLSNDQFNHFFQFFEYPSLSLPGFISLASHEGFFIETYNDQILLHQSFYSLTDLDFHAISPPYLQHINGAYDLLLLNLKPFLDCSVPIVHDTHSGASSYFEQFAFLMFEKISLAFKYADSIDSFGILEDVRRRISIQLEGLGTEDYDAKYYLYSLLLYSLEHGSMSDDKNALQVLYFQIARKNLGISVNLPFHIESLASQTYFKHLDDLLCRLSEQDFAKIASTKIFSISEVSRAGIILANHELFALSSTDLHYVNLLSFESKLNGILTLPPKHLLKDKNFVKVFGSNGLPAFSSSFLNLRGTQTFVVKSDQGVFYILLDSSAKPYIEFHSQTSERFWLIREEYYQYSPFNTNWFNSRTLWLKLNAEEIHICENVEFKNCIGQFNFQSVFKFVDDTEDSMFKSLDDAHSFPSSLDLRYTMFVNSFGQRKVEYERLYDSMGLPLTFSSKGSRTVWTFNPDFFIGHADIGLPKDFFAYTILVDESSKRARLILPIKSRIDLLFPEKTKECATKFNYETIPIENNMLVESNVKNLFYLAYLHMIYHEYELAWDFLIKITQVDPFNDEDLKFATWIFTYHLVECEHFPEIYAIEAFVSWLVFENFQNFPTELKKKKRSLDIRSLHDPASSFRVFWNNECEFALSKNAKADKMVNYAFSISQRYYEVAKMLSSKMIFTPHLKTSSAILTEYMEFQWLKSVSQNSRHPRLPMILNSPSLIELPKFQLSELSIDALNANTNTIAEAFNNQGCLITNSLYNVLYADQDPVFFLRPDFDFFSTFYKSLLNSLISGTVEEKGILLFYLRDAFHVRNSQVRALVHFLLFLNEAINNASNSSSCKTALLSLEQYLVKKSDYYISRELLQVELFCTAKSEYKSNQSQLEEKIVDSWPAEVGINLNFLPNERLRLDFRLAFGENLNFADVSLNTILNSKNLDELLAGADKWKKKLGESYNEILLLFEKLMHGNNNYYKIMSEGQSWIKPDPTDLITAFVHQSRNTFTKHLPHHSLENIKQINQLMLSFFVNQTALARLNDLLLKIDITKGLDSIKNSFVEAMIRPYFKENKDNQKPPEFIDEQNHAIIPALLVFEYQSRGTIRKEHIPDLFLLGTGRLENIVLQRMMSSGKTFVLSTLLSILRSVNNNLSILIVPQALLSTNARDIISRNLRFFNIRGKVLRFGRGPKFTNEDNLNWILHQLTIAIKEREYFITTIEDIQALRNSFLEALMNLKTNKNSVPILQKILILLKDHGVGLIDEVDWVLNPLTKLRFPVSQPQKLDRSSMEMIGELFVRFASLQEFSQMQIASPDGLTITSILYEKFKSSIIQKAAEIVLQRLSDVSKSIGLKGVAQMLTISDKNELKSILQTIPEIDQEPILTINSFIHIHFPEALGKQVNEHYGLSVKNFQQCRYAKPYVAANTPAADEKSDFSELLVIATKTFRSYFQLKLKPIQVREMIEILRAEAKLEKNKKSFSNLEETETVLKFDTCFNFKSLFKLKLTSEVELQEIIKRIDKECAYKYMVNYLIESTISKLGQFPKQLSSTASNVTSLLKSFDGYSGTIDNPNLFMHVDKNDNIYKIITAKLLKNPEIHFYDGLGLVASSMLEQLDKIISGEKMKRVSALLDIGAYFRKYSNRTIALSILKWRSAIKAVLFYDESSNDLYYHEANGEPKKSPGSSIEVIESATGFNREELFLFLDQRHCTGTDIKMSPNAIGLATASDSVMSRELFQGVMRMRDLVFGQHEILVICPSELAPKIKETLKYPQEKLLTVNELLHLAKLNSEKYRQLQTNAVYLQKLEDSIQSLVIDKMLREDVEKAARMFTSFDDLLVTFNPVMQIDKMKEINIVYDQNFIKNEYKSKLEQFQLSDKLKELVEFANSTKDKLNPVACASDSVSVGDEVHEQLQEEQEQDQEQEQEEEIVSSLSLINDRLDISTWPKDLNIIESGLSRSVMFSSLYLTVSVSDVSSYPFSTWNFQDIISRIPGFSEFSHLFDSRISVSKNFVSCRLNEVTLFKSKERFFPYQFLVLNHKNDESIPWRVILLSPFDIQQMHEKIKSELTNHNIWLFDLQLNLTFYRGRKDFPMESVELRKILVQIVALSGSLNLLSNPSLVDLAIEWARKDLHRISSLLDLLVLDNQKMAYQYSKFKLLLTSQLNSVDSRISDSAIQSIKVNEGLCYFSMKKMRDSRLILTQEKFESATNEIRLKILEGVAAIYGLASSRSPQWMHEFVENALTGLISLRNNELDFKFVRFLNQYVPSVFSNDLFGHLLTYADHLKDQNPEVLLQLIQVIGNRLNESLITMIDTLVVYQFASVLLKLAGMGSFFPMELWMKTSEKQLVLDTIADSKFPADLFDKISNLSFTLTYKQTYHQFSYQCEILFEAATGNSEFQKFLIKLTESIWKIVARAQSCGRLSEDSQWWENQ